MARRILGLVAIAGAILLIAGCELLAQFFPPETVTVIEKAPVVIVAYSQPSPYPYNLITLDASASRDPDGKALTYTWSLSAVPATSASTLTVPTDTTAEFTPDIAGEYTVRVSVTNGTTIVDADVKIIVIAALIAF
jgi:hypothetical protein